MTEAAFEDCKRRGRAAIASIVLSFAASLITGFAAAAEADAPERWAIHSQLTNVTQWHAHFRSPYSGINSLEADGRTEETTDLTLYAGARLWPGAELWLNPEVDQGFGLSNTVGVAGFPSGEAYKIGADTPYLRLPRAFLRVVVPLGGDAQAVPGQANQLAGTKAADSLTLTIGKFSVTDIFDGNVYAHDPRSDFLNWSVIDAGVFDYAADAWGFTYGAAAELAHDDWTVRGGVFQLSKEPNGKIVAVDFGQTMLVTELERRLQWPGKAGRVSLLGFVNRAPMARYDDAVQLAARSGAAPDVSLVRHRASRAGVAINVEQALATELGVFLRTGVNDGSKEAYEFTEINRTVSAGMSLKGGRWGRPEDTLGLAGVINALSAPARRYFAAGGNGILIGDGKLSYGTEQIVEATYALQINAHLNFALDYQHVNHPAYNRDRGPVSIYAVRAHVAF